ncbi:hypothetical protein K469DRAFT_652648 [Zopfia rhizophila CBS 207.26]|uniref:Uncharacterized protein n=1 Tax=Zopfia rhizophila CBS 207.26 TaxID=1314779 RepID=A0A6A6EL69_9PEZI|nr:hypothetical protein K469DRAFT_652648 [Zopfia rhizophila CBS 207.26]
MEYDGNIHRGVWAGHCFDITTLARHTENMGDEWKDVSDEIVQEIATICRLDKRREGKGEGHRA